MVRQITCRKKKKARKLKESMRKILRNLKRIQEYKKSDNKISEIDTQILLVEPVLCLAGYDIYDPFVVKRASRSRSGVQFDIEIYDHKRNLKMVIEVKSINSEEFNFDSDFNPIAPKGQLGLSCKKFKENGNKRNRIYIITEEVNLLKELEKYCSNCDLGRSSPARCTEGEFNFTNQNGEVLDS